MLFQKAAWLMTLTIIDVKYHKTVLLLWLPQFCYGADVEIFLSWYTTSQTIM